MKILKPVVIAILSLICVSAIITWDPLPKNPNFAQLSKASDKYNVEIIRDQWGVPHISGKSDADAVFGFAYAHAEDDFETIQLTVAAARGVLARYQGKNAAPTDYIVALLGVWETIEKRYASDVPQHVKAIATAYADGLNLYAAKNPDVSWKGLAPFTAEDVVAGFVFKTPFFYGLDTTLLELFGDENVHEIAMDTSKNSQAWHIGPKSMTERGSNAMAVSPLRSGDNTTRLLINSHQPMTGPVAWYEAHLVSEEGMNISGGSFPGVPIILHGFNDHLGWANTVSAQDLVDVYVLTRNKTKDQYLLDGKWETFVTKTIPIKIKLFGPFAFTAKRKVHRTQHGPVIESKHGTYALRYAGMGEIRQLEQYYGLNKSKSFEDFNNAMSLNALPSINYIYADKTGNIAFIHNAQYPNRIEGWDWKKYLPGEFSKLIWQGYRPYGDVPQLINPQSGFVFNSNNTPFSATDGPDNLAPKSFPKSMGLQTNQTNRSLRVMELTDGISKINKDRLLAIKFDTMYSQKSETARVIDEILAMDWNTDPALEEAAQHLKAWNMDMAAENRHAALGGLSVLKIITADLTHSTAPTAEAAFRWAVNYLTENYGRIDPKWGELNRLVRGDVNMALDGGADTLRAIYPQDIGTDGKLIAGGGDTWIALVEWDAEGKLSADVVHQFGSATRDTASPHYNDQAPLFASKQWRKALREPKEIRANAARTYRPQD